MHHEASLHACKVVTFSLLILYNIDGQVLHNGRFKKLKKKRKIRISARAMGKYKVEGFEKLLSLFFFFFFSFSSHLLHQFQHSSIISNPPTLFSTS
jgi:hypothetical protein